MKVTLKNVRLAFPELWTAKTFSNGEGKPAFSASALFDKSHEAVTAINTAVNQVAKDKWQGKADAVLKQLRAADRLCVHDGDGKSEYDGFAGNLYVSARNATRPVVRDRDGKTDLREEDGIPYAGAHVNMIVDVWAQDNGYGKRINASLIAVQFRAHGDRFSGSAAAEDSDFEELDADDGMDDLA